LKALALVSGGLDSTLAVKVLQEQGIEVAAINFTSPFCRCSNHAGCGHLATHMARQLGVELQIEACGEDYLRLVEQPRFGYGRHLNPCLDCRIYKFNRAKEYMRRIGASFLVTGEVLGQRPNSQRRDALRLIDRETGLEGLVLRPLSAALLEPTVPEREGWVDRARLLDIRGRTRTRQIAMAESFGLRDYPCPSGGCLLADEGFARRARDFLRHGGHLTARTATLLQTGRHFRLSDHTLGIIGRREAENAALEQLAEPDDWILRVLEHPGPVALGRGCVSEADLQRLARMVVRYSDTPAGEAASVSAALPAEEEERVLRTTAAPQTELDACRL
jgi:tRNA U34 2-thiouridine synthase MnmA/TrmU